MTPDEKAKEFCEKWIEAFPGLEERLLEGLLAVAVREGVPFKHPRTGKWHDRSGLGFDTEEGLIKYGDAFILDEPFELR